MEYKNLEKFKAFLRSVLSDRCLDVFSLRVWVEDLESQIDASGAEHYEVGSAYTRSGRPEVIYFDRIDKFFLDGVEVEPIDNNFDFVTSVIVF